MNNAIADVTRVGDTKESNTKANNANVNNDKTDGARDDIRPEKMRDIKVDIVINKFKILIHIYL